MGADGRYACEKPVLVAPGEIGVTFIGHSSFLLQMGGKNILVDPVYARWLILLRRLRRPGVRIKELPEIGLVLLTHAHMDHLNLPSLKKIVRRMRRAYGRTPEVVVPWGNEDLVSGLGFSAVHALRWWESVEVQGLKLTLNALQALGHPMVLKDNHRGYGGYGIEYKGKRLYDSGDTAYFDELQGDRTPAEAADRTATDRRVPPGQLPQCAHQS